LDVTRRSMTLHFPDTNAREYRRTVALPSGRNIPESYCAAIQ
jgi:hypothetical protein